MQNNQFDDNDDEEEEVCITCGAGPCEWEQYGRQAIDMVLGEFILDSNSPGMYIHTRDNSTVGRSAVRKATYRIFTYLKYGHLGKGNRVPIPECVLCRIREAFPEENEENYVGFQESESQKTGED